ncbi:MAG: LuxR C-terminal-related transcriptional regulator [Verrucomicrobiota bacterium]
MGAWLEVNSATYYPVYDGCTIGRGPANQVVLHSPAVSRRHAVIYGSDKLGYWIMDLASRNGVYVNEARVQSTAALQDKDVVKVGTYSLIFYRKAPRDVVQPVDANTVSSTTIFLREDSTATGYGVILLDEVGHVKRMTDTAARWLATYFQHTSGHTLPQPLRIWAKARQEALRSGGYPAHDVFRSVEGNNVLNVSVADSETDEMVLVLREEPHALSRDNLKQLGLTDREAEVLYWVAEGKNNPEIAVILDLSPRTVEKHLQNVFAKLGAENRMQALVIVNERLQVK